MSKNNNTTWKTKYGTRRVRHEEATLAEAIAAAQGLSDDRDQQVEIASSLMGLPQDEVRAALLNQAPVRKESTQTIRLTVASPGAVTRPRVVVVESKRPRRLVPATARPASSVRG